MSEHKHDAPMVEKAGGETLKVSDQLRRLTDEMTKAAEQNRGELRGAIEKTEKLREDIKKEQTRIAEDAKTKAMPEPTGRRIKMSDIMSGSVAHPQAKELQELNDNAVYRQILRGNCSHRKGPDGEHITVLSKDPADWADIPEYQEIRAKTLAAVVGDAWDTGDTDAGGAWVPTLIDTAAQDFYAIRGGLLGALQRRTIPRGVGSLSIPVITAESGPLVTAETASLTAGQMNINTVGTVTTAVATLTPVKHMETLSVSVEGTEDMAVDSLATMRRAMSQHLIGAVEEAVISGQTTDGTVLDAAPLVSELYSANGYAAVLGNSFRWHTVASSHDTDASGALTGALILGARASMGKYGVFPSELALVTSPGGYLQLLQDPNVLTVDKFGTGATILSGQVASVAGVPVIVADRFPEALDASGINNNPGTSTTTGAIVFNRSQWTLGIAREMQMAMVPQAGYDSVNIIGSVRSAFVNHLSGSATAWYLYNI
jgi:hypothetical protein